MSNRGPLNIALIGAGNISGQYLDTLGTFPDVRLTAIGDLDVSRARTAARKYHVPEAGDPESVLALPDVELVVNLTVPAAHTEVALASLRAGKHVYGEKPLALSPGTAPASSPKPAHADCASAAHPTRSSAPDCSQPNVPCRQAR
ncbi:Gfo/Idh/MocA family protein [Streptomyces sp. MS1.AVA.4]|uniref:Gfo/Idh/MocA family oxidoreductase n=1 Tax=Streptomyces pratisoli TaxID=3139917 RepID=A0ACC6QTW5_9ACTN